VVFTGTKDKQFLAFDAKSGRQLWRYQANGGVNGPPISYAVNGGQFVAVPAGGNFQINAPRSDELLAFALPGTSEGAAAEPASAEQPSRSQGGGR
jgi:quinohemoprotein ethanol dehydrogenase